MMKKKWQYMVLTLLALFTLTGCNSQPDGSKVNEETQSSLFQFKELEYDFGILKQSGGVKQHEFQFTYLGEDPITITGTPGSCACTTAKANISELSKGDTGVLTVSFNPNLHAEPVGKFSKTVVMLTHPPLKNPPEVTVWQEIDLDLGEEFFELNENSPAEDIIPADYKEPHAHNAGDHGVKDEIGNSGEVPPYEKVKGTRSFTLTAQEVNGELDEGLNYLYWTYDSVVPGPFMRAKVGETIKITLKNPKTNHFPHSIDLHSVNGPGGGASQVYPGQEKAFTFKALNPGIYVYHCASPIVAEHMTNGAYGLILIEPEKELSKVDQEYYVMQGEFYSILQRGREGSTKFSGEKMKNENPEYIVFNGRKGSLTNSRALTAKVGETVRLFVGNGGVSKVSSFHVIGEIFDTVYPEGGTPVQHNIQTTIVPPGGATIVEFTVDVPGSYKIVDHALSRLDKGALAELKVGGKNDSNIFKQF